MLHDLFSALTLQKIASFTSKLLLRLPGPTCCNSGKEDLLLLLLSWGSSIKDVHSEGTGRVGSDANRCRQEGGRV